MRKPTPPDIGEILTDLIGRKKIDLPDLLERVGPTVGDRYRSWQKVQYLSPPEGLSHREHWLGLKLSRRTLYQPLPLRDIEGEPFRLALPNVLVHYLHQIEQEAGLRGEIAERLKREGRKEVAADLLAEEAITSS